MYLSTEEWQKKRAWEDTKRAVSDTLEESWHRFQSPILDVKTDWHKKSRIGSFTDSDVDELKSVIEDKQKKDEAKQRRLDQHLEEEKLRWETLKQKWALNEAKAKEEGSDLKRYRGDIDEKPGIFRVSQNVNRDYDTFNSFVGAFPTEGDARMCHPMGGNACEYKQTELQRNESWCDTPLPFFGPAPGWYLGSGDTWVHGAFVKTERLSDYVPPDGTEHTYGIWTASFNAG